MTEVFIAEAIWFEDNPVDGRNRIAVCSSLDAALKCIKQHDIYGSENLVATEVDAGALGTKQARAWSVHEVGEEPSDEGHLWIVGERIEED